MYETQERGLSDPEKLLIIAVCLGILAVTILVTVCVVTPVCWIYACIHGKNNKDQKKQQDSEEKEEITCFKLIMVPHYGSQNGRSSDDELLGLGSKKYTEKSTYSSMSTSSRGDDTLSFYSKCSSDISVANRNVDNTCGQVSLSVTYRERENETTGQLIIYLKEAQALPPRLYGGIIDPYLVVQLFENRGRKRSKRGFFVPIFEYRTSTKRKSQHPLFEETVVVTIPKAKLEDSIVKIAVFDDEKIMNDTNLGEISVPIGNLHLADHSGEQIHVLDLLEPQQGNGEILFGLSFLPTVERLTFTIVKGNNLRVVSDSMENFAPYIRILLFHNGKLYKKRKTTCRYGSDCPSYNESLTFDLPSSEIENVMFVLIVTHRKITSSRETSSRLTDFNREHHVGKVVIGPRASGSAFCHWLAMKQSLRKQVTQWHTLN
ncbi:synaptotagmin-5-like [Tachypleus tridentatus]|uniref:synaptotagmin-5-like n=1 Tax=Tachypleus tridentatus TaxID=6853 RepID=UPI003FCFB240